LSPEYADITGEAEPQRVNGVRATAGLFELFGVPPLLGRGFLPEEELPGRNRVVVLSHGLWQRRFGSDRDLVGEPITINGEMHVVIGVMPPQFKFHSPWTQGIETDVFLPATLTDLDDGRASRDTHWLLVFARLRDGVTLASAQADMDAVARRIEERNPETNLGNGVNVVRLHGALVGKVSGSLLLFLGAAGFVLLIVCANVASLLLARATKRQREIALRCALGAGRGRLVQQLITENVPASVLGGVSGLLLAVWGVEVLRTMIPPDIPRVQEIGIDAHVLAFTGGVSVLTGFAFSLVPALSASKTVLARSLSESRGAASSGSGRDRLRDILVVTQFALSFMLVNGAALMLGSYVRLRNIDQGFTADNVLTMRLALHGPRYEDAERAHVFYRDVLERVGALPGIRAAATTSKLPLEGGTNGELTIEGGAAGGDERLESWAEVSTVHPAYFRAMGIELSAGRVPEQSETSEGQHSAVINETMAHRFWPDEDPIGKRFAFEPPNWITVVGVVGDVRQWGVERLPNPEVYLFCSASPWVSFMEWPQRSRVLVVRAAYDPLSLVPAVKQAVHVVDADQPVTDIRTMRQVVAESMARRRFNTLLIALFSGTALMLVAAGIYGVTSYFAAQRSREMGIRMALGANRRNVLGLVLQRGGTLAAIGLAVGLVGVLATTRITASMVYGVSPSDPATIAGGALFLLFVALLGSWIPARRAAGVDPVITLRNE
jgi:putative ABC transport system permease protein